MLNIKKNLSNMLNLFIIFVYVNKTCVVIINQSNILHLKLKKKCMILRPYILSLKEQEKDQD